MALKIVLADDHALVREGIRSLLEVRLPDADVVAGASTGLEALEACAKHLPDIMVLDLSMPGLGGLEVLERMPETSPRTRTLVVSQHSDRAYVLQALRSGACGYLPKRAAGRELIVAITTILQGRTYLDPDVAATVVEAAVHPTETDDDGELAKLTCREREVLKLTAEGKTAREVARLLGISFHTANRHRANLMDKLDVHSKTELVVLAVKLKLIDV